MTQAYLSLILHAHLPFVRHPEHEDFLEESWLFEAITETYLPLLRCFERLAEEGIPVRCTLSLSPTLTAMLRDPFLQKRYLQHMERLVALAGNEVERTRDQPDFRDLAVFYRDWFHDTVDAYTRRYRCDLVAALASLQEAGVLEIMTCAATHGYLPLLQPGLSAVKAQVQVGQESYRLDFGRDAGGIWLPECGYVPGLEKDLARAGLRYFIVDAHGLSHADVRPHYGCMAPVACPNGVAAFARDPSSSRQVWSASEGYPGDFDYRDFYRDIGFDLDFDYIRPYILDGATRIFTGIKYHRVTGPTETKQPYDPARAAEKVRRHAEHFLAERAKQVAEAGKGMARPPLIVSPYDAELFGHWWFEGPAFIEALFREAAGSHPDLEWVTPSDYLERHPVLQRATPSASSWGWQGYSDCWLSGSNDWIYPDLHRAARLMSELAGIHAGEEDATLIARALNQAARSLLIAQASDWTFIIKSGTSVAYAEKRIKDHLARFNYLADAVQKGEIDEEKLAALEYMDNLFPFLDFRVFGRIGRFT